MAHGPEDDSIRVLRKTTMSLLHHPAFQSLVLPFVLAVVGMVLLRALPGRAGLHWWPLGAVFGLLAALAVLPGFDWPATARAQKLPWIVLVGFALAALSMAWCWHCWLWAPVPRRPDSATRQGLAQIQRLPVPTLEPKPLPR
jgi:hypothetical protein